jgi:hypothetical protein
VGFESIAKPALRSSFHSLLNLASYGVTVVAWVERVGGEAVAALGGIAVEADPVEFYDQGVTWGGAIDIERTVSPGLM